MHSRDRRQAIRAHRTDPSARPATAGIPPSPAKMNSGKPPPSPHHPNHGGVPVPPAKTKRRSASPRPAPRRASSAGPNHQRRELVGLALLAVAALLAAQIYLGFGVGPFGGAVEQLLRLFVGRLVLILPPLLAVLGGMLIFDDDVLRMSALRIGVLVLAVSLCTALAAGLFGLNGAAHTGWFHTRIMQMRGGMAGGDRLVRDRAQRRLRRHRHPRGARSHRRPGDDHGGLTRARPAPIRERRRDGEPPSRQGGGHRHCRRLPRQPAHHPPRPRRVRVLVPRPRARARARRLRRSPSSSIR